jgi:hypothetical protein
MTTLFAAKSDNITLSGGNLIATQTANDQTFSSVFSMPATSASTKRYCELQISFTADTTNNAIGIGNANALVDDWLGSNNDSIGVYGTGTLWWGDTSVDGYTTFFIGDTVAIAVDDGAKLLWLKNVTAGGDWNNDPNADPGQSTGGYDITGMVASNAAATLFALDDAVTGNFAGPFAGVIPTGFTRWDGTLGVGGDGGDGTGGTGGTGTGGTPVNAKVVFATSPNFQLSNNNWTATKTGNDNSFDSIFSTAAEPTVAKRYCEMQLIAAVDEGQDAVGIANANALLADYWLGFDENSIGVYCVGNLWWENTFIEGFPPFFVGDIVAIAVDNVAKMFWFKNVSAGSYWNSDPMASPDLGTGGYDITGLDASRVGATLVFISDAVTANFDGPFAGIIPTNFRRWDGTLGVGSDGSTGENLAADTEFQWYESTDRHGGGGLTVSTYITNLPRSVADLQTPSLIMRGARTVVLDSSVSLAAGIGQQVVSGGAECVPVYCDGLVWRIG